MVIGFIGLLLLYNWLVWVNFTEDLLSRNQGHFTGDLARMGYLSAYTHKRNNAVDLPLQHLELFQYQQQPVDVVTIGDSFSQGCGNGLNRYYQDYIASINQLSVLNVGDFIEDVDLVGRLSILINSGYLDIVKPKYVVLEIVERNAYKYSSPIDIRTSMELNDVQQAIDIFRDAQVRNTNKNDLPETGFLNNGNVKWLLYNAFYIFSPNAFFSSVYKFNLSAPFFSGPHGDSLLVIEKSLNKIRKNNREATVGLNDNLNRIAQRLKEKGIQLCFMPAVDKYDLYEPYIVNNSLPSSRFFNDLRELPKEYHLIDSKGILSRELEKGEKDLYWIDDTHWSWKASKAIFEAFRFPAVPET